MIITDNFVEAHSNFKGDSINDEMLLEFAKFMYKKNLIKVESLYDEENDYNIIRLTCNVHQREIINNRKDTLKETEEKLKDMGMPEPIKPWYKRIFD
jgi:hypothetical protein